MANIMTEQHLLKRIGAYLVCSSGMLQNAVKKQGQMLKQGHTVKRIGEILVENGQITQDILDAAIKKQRIDRIRHCPVFSTLSDTELSAISAKFEEVTVSTGEQFIIQDQPDPTLYVIASGKVEVYRTDLDGNKTHIAYVGPPEPIGEMGYFAGGVRTASIRSVDTTQLLVAQYDDLTHYFENVPRVAHAFLQMVEERRRATEQIMQQQNNS